MKLLLPVPPLILLLSAVAVPVSVKYWSLSVRGREIFLMEKLAAAAFACCLFAILLWLKPPKAPNLISTVFSSALSFDSRDIDELLPPFEDERCSFLTVVNFLPLFDLLLDLSLLDLLLSLVRFLSLLPECSRGEYLSRYMWSAPFLRLMRLEESFLFRRSLDLNLLGDGDLRAPLVLLSLGDRNVSRELESDLELDLLRFLVERLDLRLLLSALAFESSEEFDLSCRSLIVVVTCLNFWNRTTCQHWHFRWVHETELRNY